LWERGDLSGAVVKKKAPLSQRRLEGNPEYYQGMVQILRGRSPISREGGGSECEGKKKKKEGVAIKKGSISLPQKDLSVSMECPLT